MPRPSLILAAAGVVAAARVLRSRRRVSFARRVAVISGGSRGLGLLLARRLVDEGAHVALLARTPEDLDAAVAELGAAALAVPCDVRDKRAVESAISVVVERLGAPALLIHDAGVISVGPEEHMDDAAYAESLGVHFWGALYLTEAVRPHLPTDGTARIGYVASIGGRVSIPHLGPYSVGKHALVGYADAMRAELAEDGIAVTTITPGLLRTGSHPNAQITGQHEKEYAWFAIGDATPFASMDGGRAADQILDALRHGDPALTLTLPAKLAAAADGVVPGLVGQISTLVARLLPAATGSEGDDSKTGWQSVSALAPSPLTALADAQTAPKQRTARPRPAGRRRRVISVPTGADMRLLARAEPLGLRPPAPGLRVVVGIPARDEADGAVGLVEALARQVDAAGRPLAPGTVEAILLVNNTTDGTAEVARRAAREVAGVTVHVAEVCLARHEAHVGRARQLALDAAYLRLGGQGLILTTDADTRPAPDWIAQTEAEIALGVDAVGGRILLHPDDCAALPPALARLVHLDAEYRRALERVRDLLAPDAHDPYPRHHQHFGGSFAVTAAAYARAGGIPCVPHLEDLEFYRALVACGARVRHSDRVRVWTSARRVGRAGAGLAHEMARMDGLAADGLPLLVESAAHAGARLADLGRWRLRHPDCPPPVSLTEAPHPLPSSAQQDVGGALADMLSLAERLEQLSFEARLDLAPARLAA